MTQSVIHLTFPRDEGRHRDENFEWWFFKGHAQADDGSHYSFVLAYFAPSSFENLNVGYFLSIVDEDKRICYRAFAKGKSSRSRYSEHRLDLLYGPNWWRQGDKVFTYQMHNQALGDMPISLDLRMKSLKPPVLTNGIGIVKGNWGYSYYYIQPRMDFNGDLTIGNKTKHVHGVGWIERQWGNCEWGLIGGWEWFGINLNRNIEAHVSFLLDPITRAHRPWVCNIISKDSMSVLNTFVLHHLGYWRSKRGCLYPSGWKIIAPERQIKLTLSPFLKDQEIKKGLWEGACAVKGTVDGRQVSGRAFAECAYNPSNLFVRAPYYVATKFLSRLHMLSPIRSLKRKMAS